MKNTQTIKSSRISKNYVDSKSRDLRVAKKTRNVLNDIFLYVGTTKTIPIALAMKIEKLDNSEINIKIKKWIKTRKVK